MKLSVIVPVYNVEKYLAECVDSLLNQTLSDMEIFLVDDGSKDSSGAICDRYAKEYPDKVKCLHIDNGGQGRARNFALPMAQGEYLGTKSSAAGRTRRGQTLPPAIFLSALTTALRGKSPARSRIIP